MGVKCFFGFLQGLLKKNKGSHSGPLSLREAAVTDAWAQTTRPAHRRCLNIPNDETFVFFLTTLPKIKKILLQAPQQSSDTGAIAAGNQPSFLIKRRPFSPLFSFPPAQKRSSIPGDFNAKRYPSPGKELLLFHFIYPSFKGFTLTPGPIVEVIVTLFI